MMTSYFIVNWALWRAFLGKCFVCWKTLTEKSQARVQEVLKNMRFLKWPTWFINPTRGLFYLNEAF